MNDTSRDFPIRFPTQRGPGLSILERDEVFRYPGEETGFWAYRSTLDGPPEYERGTIFPYQEHIWPPRPSRMAQLGFSAWVVLRRVMIALHIRHDASDLRDRTLTANLWKRHPWMRSGNIWWRPYWGGDYGNPEHTMETFDPSPESPHEKGYGLHRWIIDTEINRNFAMDVEAYYCAVLKRNLL